MAHRLAALGEDFALLHTPTGDEADEVADYVRATAAALGRDLIVPPGPTLDELEAQFNALPNNRQRWCTRMIKIVPCNAPKSAGSTARGAWRWRTRWRPTKRRASRNG